MMEYMGPRSFSNPTAGRALAPKRTPATPAAATTTAAAWAGAAAAAPQVVDPFQFNPLRKLSFYFGMAVLFVRLGVLPEVIYVMTGVNTYLLYLVTPPAIIGALLTGGLRRTFRQRAAYYWVFFFGWMILAVPFSFWPGGSFQRIKDYGRADFILLIMVAGLVVTWKEIRTVFYTIAAAALINLLTARIFLDVESGRATLAKAAGTIGNSNDLAAHLLLELPFLLFITMDHKKNIFMRIAVVLPIAYGLWIILGTASRGALIAIAAGVLFTFWRAAGRQRFTLIVPTILLTAGIAAVLPQGPLDRLAALFGKEHIEADESAASRSYLFKKSVLFTLSHPVFGVGPDQFSNYEGNSSVKQGQLGSWHATHCAFTQVSSECGIPALILFICGIGSAFVLVSRTYRAARQQGQREIANSCFCYMLAMVCFIAAITFLSNAYRFYLPVMIGLAISMSFAAKEQMSQGGNSPIAPSLPLGYSSRAV
jgi:O-Antigen ligase